MIGGVQEGICRKRERESRECVGGIFFFGGKTEKNIVICESGDDVGRRVLTGYEYKELYIAWAVL